MLYKYTIKKVHMTLFQNFVAKDKKNKRFGRGR